MPWQSGTLTDDDIALELGIAVDDRVSLAADAARAWAAERVNADPFTLWSHPARHRGGVLEGCYQYQLRAAPQAQASYETTSYETRALHWEAERLINPDPVIA